MPELIVDALEPVDVEVDDRRRSVVTPQTVQGLRDALQPRCPVEGTGEDVSARGSAQRHNGGCEACLVVQDLFVRMPELPRP